MFSFAPFFALFDRFISICYNSLLVKVFHLGLTWGMETMETRKAVSVAQQTMDVDTVIKRHIQQVEKADRALYNALQAKTLHRRKRFNGKVGFIEYFTNILKGE